MCDSQRWDTFLRCYHANPLFLCSFQLKPTLSQLHADLKLYEHHFEWLNRVSKKHHHPSLPKLVEMIKEMKSLITLLHFQVKSSQLLSEFYFHPVHS